MSSVTKIPETLLATFLSAYWVWTPEADVTNPPVGSRAFRYTYTTPAGKTATSALILITVDNKYSLFVNGQRVGTSSYAIDSWKSAQIFNVAPLDPQSNLFALNGTNAFDDTGMLNPAGLLCAIQITFSDRTTTTFSSDGTWKSFGTVSAGFESLSTNDSTWEGSIPIAQYGSGLWETKVVLPESVPQQTIIPLLKPTAPTFGAETKSTSIPFPTSRSTIISLPNSPASTTGSETTTASVPFSTSRNTTSVSATPVLSNTKVNVVTIVSGVIGGLTALIFTVFLIVLLKRQKRMRGDGGKVSAASAFRHVDGTGNTGGHGVITPFPLTPRVIAWAGTGAWVGRNRQYHNMEHSNNDPVSAHGHMNRWVHGLNENLIETIGTTPRQTYRRGQIMDPDGSQYLDPDVRAERPPTYRSLPSL